MPNETMHEGEPSINGVLAEIELIKAQIASVGGNDSEMLELNAIAQAVQKGKLSPKDGRAQARAIFERKMGYH